MRQETPRGWPCPPMPPRRAPRSIRGRSPSPSVRGNDRAPCLALWRKPDGDRIARLVLGDLRRRLRVAPYRFVLDREPDREPRSLKAKSEVADAIRVGVLVSCRVEKIHSKLSKLELMDHAVSFLSRHTRPTSNRAHDTNDFALRNGVRTETQPHQIVRKVT